MNIENVNKSIIDSKLLNALLKDGNISIFSDAYHIFIIITADIDGGVAGLFLIIVTQNINAIVVNIANNKFMKSI